MNGVSYFQDLLTSIFERGSSTSKQTDDRSIEALCDALLSERGEVSGNQISLAILNRFDECDRDGQIAFFEMLTERYDIDSNEVATLAKLYGEKKDPKVFERLMEQSQPRRQELLRRLNRLPGATGRLVKMRESLLALLREYPSYRRCDLDFEHLFNSWFNRGFLVMRRINWRAPANLLEKIIQYEAVHEINDWDDLRRRMQPPDRRCFAFFHPAMPDEPLIFVEVALTKAIPSSIQEVLASEREALDQHEANTAVFYSISNCQKGLKGVSFGNFLIKQVANDLAEDLPQLKSFVTLSPVPGFMRWVNQQLHKPDPDPDLLKLQQLANGGNDELESSDLDSTSGLAVATRYLLEAKRADGQPYDPVARFHLGNGASLENVHWLADKSSNGLDLSAGVMVNYLYNLKKIEQQHEAYAHARKVTSSRVVRALLPKRQKTDN